MPQWHEKEEKRHVTLLNKETRDRLRPEVHKLYEGSNINKKKLN